MRVRVLTIYGQVTLGGRFSWITPWPRAAHGADLAAPVRNTRKLLEKSLGRRRGGRLRRALFGAQVPGQRLRIALRRLPELILDAPAASEVAGGYYQTFREEKKRAILAALGRSGGNFTEAAKLLAIHPNYLHRLVRNLELKAEVKKA